jgi:MEDS: MEthanogen/methylotroph, DcmR Sensory domain
LENVVRTEFTDGGHHAVQFYGNDDELAERVTSYLLGALSCGGAAVIIADAAHRREVEARLTVAGVDLAAAVASGAYLALDAETTVREFTVGEQLDSTGLSRAIGDLINEAGAASWPVRVYSKTVALLWNAGFVTAAVQLETLWNDLGRHYSFARSCDYPASAAARSGRPGAVAEVCRLHGEVAGLPAGLDVPAARDVQGAVRTFAFSPDAPAAARHFAAGEMRRWATADTTELADDAALVVTELAANAIVHARSGFTLALWAHRDVLRISVRDRSPLPRPEDGPALPPAPLHGLGAVDALAKRWGVEPLGTAGKTVWVDLYR